MHAASGSAPVLFDFKSATLSLEAFLLKTGNLQSLEKALEERFGSTPDLFNGEPVVIDLTHLASLDVAIDFPGLVALLQRFRLKPVAVRGATVAQTQAAREAGLAEAPDSPPSTRTETVVKEVIKEVVREVQVPVEVPVAGHTLIVDKPLRSGQQIYAKGCDLIVTAVVNHGAEVIADGSIHIYGTLRGRALAGAQGNTAARIFCRDFHAELVAIAGHYKVLDDVPDNLRGKAVQVWLEQDQIKIAALD